MGRAIAFVLSSRFGAGSPAYHRSTDAPRWVDTVWGGCYRREVFERIGLFDEELSKGQDREFNQRLRDSGGKILQIPDLEVLYYTTRTDLKQYFRWMLLVGVTPFYAQRICGRPLVKLRNFIPLVFVTALTAAIAAALTLHNGVLILAVVLAPYASAALGATIPLCRREKDPRYLLVMPPLFAVTHILYGLGSIWGLLKPVPQKAARTL